MLALVSEPHSLPPHLLLTLLLGLSGVASQSEELQVIQPEKSVTFTAGETATLHCHVIPTQVGPPARWYRDTERGRQLFYDFQEGHFPRVTNASDITQKGNVDFSIHIHDITLADAGTYTCEKINIQPPLHVVSKSGQGTLVSVRVPPTLEIYEFPEVENQVNLTCQVMKFYPPKLQLTWLEDGNVSWTETTSLLLQNKDGTFNQTSWLLVNSSAHRENVVFTCQVEHDGQPALTRSHTLKVTDQGSKEQPDSRPSSLFLTLPLSLLIVTKMLMVISASIMYLVRKLEV